MKLFVSLNKMVALAMLALIVSCATMNGPQTLQDRIQYAKASVTAAYRTIDVLAQRGRITKAEGRILIDKADSAKAALSASEAALTAGNSGDASQALDMALKGLTALETYLKSKEQQ